MGLRTGRADYYQTGQISGHRSDHRTDIISHCRKKLSHDYRTLNVPNKLQDNICYHMDTSRIHTAANFGYKDRIQLVIRKLLTRHKLKDPVLIKIRPVDKPHNLRYLFDKHFFIGNKANRKGHNQRCQINSRT